MLQYSQHHSHMLWSHLQYLKQIEKNLFPISSLNCWISVHLSDLTSMTGGFHSAQ